MDRPRHHSAMRPVPRGSNSTRRRKTSVSRQSAIQPVGSKSELRLRQLAKIARKDSLPCTGGRTSIKLLTTYTPERWAHRRGIAL
jgi:hypothetical protein